MVVGASLFLLSFSKTILARLLRFFQIAWWFFIFALKSTISREGFRGGFYWRVWIQELLGTVYLMIGNDIFCFVGATPWLLDSLFFFSFWWMPEEKIGTQTVSGLRSLFFGTRSMDIKVAREERYFKFSWIQEKTRLGQNSEARGLKLFGIFETEK